MSLRSVPCQIKSLRDQLQLLEGKCQLLEVEIVDVGERNKTRKELNKLLHQEVLYWHQRSRVAWLRDGDRNTRFFHASASHRRKVNTIEKSKDNNDIWVNTGSGISEVAA